MLNRAINAGLADPKLKARFAELSATVLPGSPDDFRKLLVDETQRPRIQLFGSICQSGNSNCPDAEKVHLVRLAYPAFLLVHLEPHAPLKEMTNRSHDALSGPRAAHEDVAIVGGRQVLGC
jgi:hypothetical protein